ncbi:type II secretion system F family protein [Rhodospirillum rubrum]|uniref:Type II secretion system protein n=1 Tax=Rhodospirillum rubrum (strain ATCC 11170 / ATH 1.1.1 / DSM 467 / LMG 4362 / NCIMB 8255 / S1) TaxID=269796 RepID=Q2RY76_RHORT|nr:type II secretion system F family protein [Rhodospirillum rubrum]ABC20919.1 type II secretion system protein [Rhodospirillum rubrum ATCC 11170]AEO46587.1 type II secretion system protein [Rhodospirillum rubrum F11]MBK5952478.1 type II secretion system protein [Rhodospirillum rubrum]QXG80617.1 type II secretion system F family protein [Rhodospirillum rubrum]HCF16864.1 type II secretion system F family protein [Rhodospirillum rubrum]
MTLYAYRAVNARGRVVRGRLEAEGEGALQRGLLGAGLHLLAARPASRPDRRGPLAWIGGLVGRRGAIAERELQQLFLHLDRALGAGVPLLEALDDIGEVTGDGRLRMILRRVRGDLSQGLALSDALGRHERALGPMVAPVVRAGEESGDLGGAFGPLVAHLRWREDLGRRLRKATRYPLVVLGAIALLFVFLMAVVVPDLASFLGGLGEGLPPQTRALIGLSGLIVDHAFALGFLALAGLLAPGLARRMSDEAAYRLDAWILALPLGGPLIRRIALSRFCHFFALMVGAGVPLAVCLATARGVLGNRCLAEALDTATAAVTAGHPLSDALRLSGQFPPLVTRMVRIGEDGGDLAGALGHVSAFHDGDVAEATDRLIGLLEPALLLVAGGLLGWIVWAVLLPVYDSLIVLAG